MATKRGLSVWGWTMLIVLSGTCFVGCGGNAKSGGTGVNAGSSSDGGPDGPGAPSEATDTSPSATSPASGPGWSIRDRTPYSRTEHATVLDEARDRMLVIGGSRGLDLWALPLSGGDKNRWTQILPRGDAPPLDESNVGSPVSAVYDPFAQRVLVLRADSYQFETPRIWELTLDEAPAWHELTLAGPAPGAELDQGKMVVDRSGQRVLIVGGGLNSSGTWALSLDGSARWSRLADAPAQDTFTRSPFPLGINTGALFVDAPRERLVFISGGLREPAYVWTLPLAGGDWALEASGSCGPDYDASSTYDSVHDRVLFFGENCGVSSYELATGEWRGWHTSVTPLAQPFFAVSSIDDPQRGRALFFSGGISAGNATTALRYDDLSVSVLVPNTLGITPGGTSAVWDEQRKALVAFGAYNGAQPTKVHGSAVGDRWLGVAGAQPAYSVGAYDTIGHAVIALGHVDGALPSEHLARLSSKPGSAWEELTVPDGPEVREWPVAVYDSARQRLVVHGGQAPGYPSAKFFDDTWALSLAGDPQWTELATGGDSGGPRARQAAIFDPVGQRMIAYGGSIDNSASDGPGDLHQLMLDDSLKWSEMLASGTGPPHRHEVLALYDAPSERMLVLDRTHLFALTLGEDPTWHRFCEPGMTMPGSIPEFILDNGPSSTLLGVAPDGLFAALGDGTFRFDLATPYCD